MTTCPAPKWHRYPSYVIAHLEAQLAQPKRSKAQLKRLLYIHYLYRCALRPLGCMIRTTLMLTAACLAVYLAAIVRFMRTGEGTLNDAEKLTEHLEGAPEAVLVRLRGEFAETYSSPGNDALKYVFGIQGIYADRRLTAPPPLGNFEVTFIAGTG